MALWSEFGQLFTALASQDSFEIRTALRNELTWIAGVIFLLVAGSALAWVYHRVPLFERYFEKSVMIFSYLAMALIIFWGVINRFVFQNQEPWSTTVPPLLFMILAWFGAAYNIRVRTHLSFSEFRGGSPRPIQFLFLCIDFLLWFGFALIFLVTTSRLVALSASNFQIVLGTDNTLQWWFLVTAPVAATLMAARAIENIQDDFRNLRSGEPLIRRAVIGGEN